MIIRHPITLAIARSKISYCSETGELRWKNARSKKLNGRLAGYKGKKYIQVRIGEKAIQGHKLAWLLHYGAEPDEGLLIDHINRNGHDNRISNLRAVRPTINVINRPGTYHRGVCFCRQTGKWKATATVSYRQIWLGRFESLDSALAARIDCESRLYPGIEFPRSGA